MLTKSDFASRDLLKAVKYLPHLTAFFRFLARPRSRKGSTADQFMANFAGWDDFLDYDDSLADIPVEGICQFGGLPWLEIDNYSPRPTEWMAMNRLTLPLLLLTLTFVGSGCQTVPSCNSCHFPGETVATSSCGGCGKADCCDASCCGPKYDVCLPRVPWGALRDCIRARVTCGAGCSEEVYWGEWFSDPPKCDPCCGDQYVGPRPPGSCRPRLIELLHVGKHCGTGNCGSCSGCGITPAYQMSSGHTSELHYSGEFHHHEETVPSEYYEPSDQVLHTHQQPTYPTSRGTRSPHQLGRGSL